MYIALSFSGVGRIHAALWWYFYNYIVISFSGVGRIHAALWCFMDYCLSCSLLAIALSVIWRFVSSDYP